MESTDHGAGGPTDHLVKTKDGGGGRSMEKYQGEASTSIHALVKPESSKPILKLMMRLAKLVSPREVL